MRSNINKQIDYQTRRIIEEGLEKGETQRSIAEKLGKTFVALNAEIKKGTKKMKNTKGETVYKYYADFAQQVSEKAKTQKRKRLVTPEHVIIKLKELVDEGEDSKAIYYELQEKFEEHAPSQATTYRIIRKYKSEKSDEERIVSAEKFCKIADNAFVESDFEKAFNYYQKGASLNHATCMTALAKLYFSGEAGVQDFRKGFTLFEAAADLKDSEAMWRKAWCYENGLGVKQNIDTSVEWYALSAFAGNQIGMTMTAYYLLHGTAANQDTKSAIKWFKRAAKLGNMYAQKWLYLNEKKVMDRLHEPINFTYDEFFDFLKGTKNAFSPIDLGDEKFMDTMENFKESGLISEVMTED